MPVNADGFRETGTFLKAIALLPYIKALGADTIHLLPITAHGEDGMKGNLGSPYAIRNPYELDETLSEPALGLGVKKEFRAFVEAAHHLGMAVVLEFVFRTAAKDSDWAQNHPDWFYWIKADVQDRASGSLDENAYGAPIFDRPTLDIIYDRIKHENLEDTVPPSKIYRDMFTEPPPASSVRKEGARWIGELADGTKVRVPGAFADWPPDDTQPPWGDVTYLKLYDHPDFNYIAYNTVRKYDAALGRPAYAKNDLWEEIEGILPFYQVEFGIDGVMVDMGHALPHGLFNNIVRRARDVNPNFAFWEESFAPTFESRENGYNISVGYFWIDVFNPEKTAAFIKICSEEGLPIPFFGTPETHDSPRCAAKRDVEFAKYVWRLCCTLPVVPYIHGGFELGEKAPVNTGLGFSMEESRQYPPEKLALFSATALNWLGSLELARFIQEVVGKRNEIKPEGKIEEIL